MADTLHCFAYTVCLCLFVLFIWLRCRKADKETTIQQSVSDAVDQSRFYDTTMSGSTRHDDRGT